MTGVIKWGNLDRNFSTGRASCEDDDRHQGDASASQRLPKIGSKLPEAIEGCLLPVPQWEWTVEGRPVQWELLLLEMPPQEEREGELYYGLSFPLPSYV